MDIGKLFPPIHYSRSKRFYKNALCLRELGEDLYDENEVLNLVGFCGSLYGNYKSREREMVEKYIENIDGELTPSKLLDLLIEKLNPDEIVKDRLYSIRDACKLNKKGFNVNLLLKLVKEDKKIKTYTVGRTTCIRGEDVPYLEHIMKESKRIDKRFKHSYPFVREGDEYISVIDIAGELGMHLSSMDNKLKKRPEARKMIYRILNTGKRMVRKEHRKKFIEIITKPAEREGEKNK
jgi:hypothetical protein